MPKRFISLLKKVDWKANTKKDQSWLIFRWWIAGIKLLAWQGLCEPSTYRTALEILHCALFLVITSVFFQVIFFLNGWYPIQ